MPSNYTGSRTATQPPSPAPSPGGSPVVALPADGDPPNASTFAQAFKVLADFIAWLFRPTAKATDWSTWLMSWRNAQNQRRFAIDHMGFPSGKLVHYREVWGTPSGTTIATSGYAAVAGLPGWYTITGIGGNVVPVDPDTVGAHDKRSRFIDVATTTVLGDIGLLARGPDVCLTADVAYMLEFDAAIPGGNDATGAWAGFIETLGVAGPGSPVKGGEFRKVSGNANWQCVAGDGTAETIVDSGVAISTNNMQRLRIEYYGPNVDDSATERVVFIINEGVVANITTNMPGVMLAGPRFAAKCTSGGTAAHIHVGTLNVAANMWPNSL